VITIPDMLRVLFCLDPSGVSGTVLQWHCSVAVCFHADGNCRVKIDKLVTFQHDERTKHMNGFNYVIA